MTQNEVQTKQWFGHPPQLARLFVTEMWERFGYYGMRAILTLYLVDFFFFSDKTANALYGAFTSLVYLTPLFGGMLADQILGSKRAVKFGAILMSLGYFGLCFSGSEAVPFATIDGKRTEIEQIKEKDPESKKDKKTQLLLIEGKKYFFKGLEDGRIELTDQSDSSNKKMLAKGTCKFSADRDAFRVSWMFLSLACVIIGNGFFKPNISTMVGGLYPPGDGRRDAGFTIFYMGINLGALISQTLCPLVAAVFGFWVGFLLAAIGMAFAWVMFQFDGQILKGHGEPPDAKSNAHWGVFLGAIVVIPLAWYFLNNTMVVTMADDLKQVVSEGSSAAKSTWALAFDYLYGLPILGKLLFLLFTVSSIGIPIWAYFAGTKVELQKMIVATILIVFSVVFWTLFEQAGSSLTLFASRNTDLRLFGYELEAGQAQLFNGLFIVLLAPLFSYLWSFLASKNLEPSIPIKFSLALMLVGVGFLALVFGSRFVDADYRVGIWWLILIYLIHTIAELCLSPVGLSMVTKLSMVRVVGLMMGVWFLSTAMAQYVAGLIAQFASVETVGGEVLDPAKALATYVGVFSQIGWASIIIGTVLLIGSPFLKKMMHGVR